MNTIETNDVDEKNKNLTFKINTLLNHTYQKTNNTFRRPWYSYAWCLIKYSHNHFVISGSLWNCYRDEVNFDANEIVANYRINNKKSTTGISFEYKRK